MHIAIDLLIAEKEPGGMLFATRALLEGLARVDRVNDYTIITAQPQEYQALAPNMQVCPVMLPSQRALLIQHQLALPDLLRKLRPTVLHVPTFAAPIGWHGPLVLTIHDLGFLTSPDQSSLYTRLYWQYLLRESVRRARCLIAVSGQTRSELMQRWSVEQERIHLIHNALRPALSPLDITAGETQIMKQRYGGKYLLHVGRIIPRKNVATLIEAFELLAARFVDLQLVLAGGSGPGSEEVLQQIAASPYHARIHQPGWVSDHNLRLLYAGACALVFPSRYEGFGLPTLEAMACGVPVVASPEAASAEIAGNAILRTECASPGMLADALFQVLTDPALRTYLIYRGQAQALTFNCEACAAATLRVYEKAATQDTPDSNTLPA